MTEFDGRLKEYVGLIEGHLPLYFEHDGPLPGRKVADAMRYSLLSGGKRVRGVLTLAFYRLFREDVRPALPFASAVEMIHAYSLIHDDLPCMDDDDMRRGKPSCHIAFGEATALLAGDALLTLAFEAASAAGGFPAAAVLRVIRLLAFHSGMLGMIAGQAMDLEGEGRILTGEELSGINARKTGALIRAAALTGCCLGGATEAQEQAALGYASHLAQAFQIMDDILDVTADPAVLGKPVGSDREKGKNTYAALYGVEACRRLVEEHTCEAKERLRAAGLEAGFLCGLADMLGGRAY